MAGSGERIRSGQAIALHRRLVAEKAASIIWATVVLGPFEKTKHVGAVGSSGRAEPLPGAIGAVSAWVRGFCDYAAHAAAKKFRPGCQCVHGHAPIYIRTYGLKIS